METLWPVVVEIGEVWTVYQEEKCRGGTAGLGDVWPCLALGGEGDELVAFHKLSQWMIYSLIEPMERLLGAIIEGTEQLTPLPDYANGMLLFFSLMRLRLTIRRNYTFINLQLSYRRFINGYRFYFLETGRL